MTFQALVKMNSSAHPGSFRDPSGFLFFREGLLYRQINHEYSETYEHLIESGLYDKLVERHLLIPHEETSVQPATPETAYKIIVPEQVPYISYGYEWCFSQLKDAALATLTIQKLAMSHGMSLKDASVYNIQFHRNHPVLIDTLSFEKLPAGKPWVAYRQFCQHFLAPLALMSYRDVRLSSLLRLYIDGVPLDLASSLLPFRSRFSIPLLMHIHLHAKSQKRYASRHEPLEKKQRQISKRSLIGIIDSLTSAVSKLKWRPADTEWGDYYNATNYSQSALGEKGRYVADFLKTIEPKSVWDLGANTGLFSRIASDQEISTLAYDIDPAAVEINYLGCKERGEQNQLPLICDLTNPSPDQGWAHQERESLISRGPADVAMALALIHHLAISNNVPLSQAAKFLSRLCRHLIIEFVPKSDSQVKKLLTTREDVFPDYEQAAFERAFAEYFSQEEAVQIPGAERTLYRFANRNQDL